MLRKRLPKCGVCAPVAPPESADIAVRTLIVKMIFFTSISFARPGGARYAPRFLQAGG
jgi:hypothetical protein